MKTLDRGPLYPLLHSMLRMAIFLCSFLPANAVRSGERPVKSDEPVPVILDTDIGTDVDDAYALVLAARSPRINLLGVTTVYGDVSTRSAIARKLLLLMDRKDVPVASGAQTPLNTDQIFWGGWEGMGLIGADEVVEGISPLPAHELIRKIILGHDQPVVIVSVGGLTNVARVLTDYPDLKTRIERIVIMGGTVHPLVVEGKTLPPRMETNLHHDVAAARITLESGIPITLVPAEVTFQTNLYNNDFELLRSSDTPLARSLVRMTEIWSPPLRQVMTQLGVQEYYDNGVVMLHDPLAVCLLIDNKVGRLAIQRVHLETSPNEIRLIADENGPIEMDLVVSAELKRLSRRVSDACIQPL